MHVRVKITQLGASVRIGRPIELSQKSGQSEIYILINDLCLAGREAKGSGAGVYIQKSMPRWMSLDTLDGCACMCVCVCSAWIKVKRQA